MSRRKPEHSGSGSITPGQLWILVKVNKRFCVSLGLLGAFFAFVLGLMEVPYYSSTSKLQFKSADVGKTLVQAVINESDNLGIKEFMDRSLGVVRSDSFREELAAQIKAAEGKRRLVLAWAVGSRLRIQYALERLGISRPQYEPIDLDSLSKDEIAALLIKMINATPDYKEQTAEIAITGLEPLTVSRINSIVVEALIQTNGKIKQAELEKSIDFLRSQRESARQKLVEANDNLRLFYQEHPEMMSNQQKPNAIDERADLIDQKKKLIEDQESNRKLLAFYKKKYMNFGKDSDTTAEVFNKFKAELVELKYKRKKFIFQGYSEKDDGILELDKKIAELEKILSNSNNQHVEEARLVGVGHDQTISDKIMELQDTIKKQQFEVEAITKRLEKVNPNTGDMSRALMLVENLKLDVRLATSLFEEITKKLEYAEMRKSGGDDEQILLKDSPSVPIRSNGSPIVLRVFFAFCVGLMLAISWLVLSATFSFRITDWQNVVDMGLNYIGLLHDYDPDLSEILMNLDCLDKGDSGEVPILLCTSPEESVSFEEVQMLSNFLARQGELSLFILVGETRLNPRFRLVSDIGFAKVYSHPNEKEFVLQIDDRESIKSLRECIKILEDTYKVRYACVFLYFLRGLNDPSYHLGLKIASKILLLGPPAKYTSEDYFKLVYGLKDLSSTNFAFAELSIGRPKARSSRRRAPDFKQFSEQYAQRESPGLGQKVKDIFFDP